MIPNQHLNFKRLYINIVFFCLGIGILRHHLMNKKSSEEIILMSVDSIESPEKKYDAAGNAGVAVKKTKKVPRTVASQMNDFIEESDLVSSDDDANKKSKKKRKSFKCRICEKVCNSKNSLQYHFLYHTGERPHMCDICGKGFFAAGALKVICGFNNISFYIYRCEYRCNLKIVWGWVVGTRRNKANLYF